jgi:hypothetical protein
MTDSSPSKAKPSNVVRLSKRTTEYMKSEASSRQLVRWIKAYYAKDNRDVNVWVEKERLGHGEYIWVVRSNIVMAVPQL